MGSVRITINAAAVEALAHGREVEALVGKALKAGEESAKRFVPVRTGALRDDITSEQTGTTGKYGNLSGSLDYPIYVEFGTGKMAAQPYLRPSIDAMKQALK